MVNKNHVAEWEATAGFLLRGDSVCLAIKQFKVAAGFRMPYGGMVNPGESYEDCMVRELYEESGVMCTTADIEKVGILQVRKSSRGNGTFEKRTVAIYLIHDWIGDPQNSLEMKDPQWFHKDHLPLENMLPADRQWVPLILAGKNVIVEAFYDARYRMYRERPVKIQADIRRIRN